MSITLITDNDKDTIEVENTHHKESAVALITVTDYSLSGGARFAMVALSRRQVLRLIWALLRRMF